MPLPTRPSSLGLLIAYCALLCFPPLHAAPQGTAISYQGELRFNGQPAQGAFDFEVALFDVGGGGTPIDTRAIADSLVEAGLFNLSLDFTSVPFEASQQYWLELRVREGASSGAFTVLQPRRALTAAPYALNALSVAAGAVGTAEIDPAQVQRRVAGTCTRGISAIAADGSVTCDPAAARSIPAPSVTQVVPSNAASVATTLAPDGLPLIAYYQGTNNQLRLIRCLDPNCTQRTDTLVVGTGLPGPDIAITIDGRGLPVIGYYERNALDAVLAFCDTLACGAPTTRVIDAAGDVGASISIDITSVTGRVVAAYYDRTNGNPKLAICNDASCTSTTASIVDNGATDDGRVLSLISTSGFLVVAYSAATDTQLRIAYCPFNGCTTTTRVVSPSGTAIVAIDTAMLSSGQPVILFSRGSSTHYVACNDAACSASNALVDQGSASSRVAISVGLDNLPFLAFADGGGIYTVRKCQAAANCAATTTWNVGAGPQVGMIDVVTSPLDGLPRIAYVASGSVALRVTASPMGAFGGRMR